MAFKQCRSERILTAFKDGLESSHPIDTARRCENDHTQKNTRRSPPMTPIF